MNNSTFKDLDEFFSQYPLKQYHKGQILIYAGEDPVGIYYLVSGKVRKYDVSAYGNEVVLNVFTSSVFFPMSWAINKTSNRYFYEAITPIEARRAPVADVEQYLASHPTTTYNLLKQVYAGLEDTQRRVVHLMRGDARSRLLFELILEAQRSGELRKDGSYVILISANAFSQRAGLSRERISRELSKLTEPNGLLIREGRSIVIRNLRALEEELDGDCS